MTKKDKIWIGVIIICVGLSGFFYHLNEKTLKERKEVEDFLFRMEDLDKKTKEITNKIDMEKLEKEHNEISEKIK